jgi:hypothetical protein
MRMIAIVLIIVGILAVGYQGFTYVTHDKVVDIGPIEVTKEDTKTVALPPIIGALVLAGGVVLLLSNSKKA